MRVFLCVMGIFASAFQNSFSECEREEKIEKRTEKGERSQSAEHYRIRNKYRVSVPIHVRYA